MSLKRALQVDDMLQLNVVSDPQFTPDGRAFTYTMTTINDQNEYESQLMYQRLKDKHATPWTFHASKNSNLRFSPDGKRAVFQSTRSGRPQLWLIHTDGGEAKQLTTFRHGATNPIWSKDGKHVFFTAFLEADDDIHNQKEPTKEEEQKEKEQKQKKPLIVNRITYKSDARGFHDQKRAQIIMLTIYDEALYQLTEADADHVLQDISPDGTTLLYAANLTDNADYELTNDLYCLHLMTKATSKLTDGKSTYDKAVFSPDGSKIASFGHEFAYKGASLTELYVFDIKTKERTCLSKDWDVELGDAMIGDTRLGESESGPIWNEDSSKIFFIATDQGATEFHAASIDGGNEVIYKQNNHIFGFSYDKYSNSFILGMSRPTNPGEFYLLQEDGTLEPMTDNNRTFLRDVDLQEPEELLIQTEDNWEVQGWLLRPYGFTEGKKYPTILEIHGGPHAMYGQTFFFEMQLLAAKGYVVLYTNPRGSHGYGQAFVNACRGDYGGGDYRDIMAAVDYAMHQYSFIDEQRLGVTGGSYGGFMTNWIVGHTNRFKAAVTQRSISNWLSFYGVSDIGFFFTEWEHGVNLLDDPAKLWEFSPLKYAKNVETPLLILHGELDYRCPIEQGEQLFITLKHLKKEVEFVRFPHANHELSRSGNPDMRIERLNHIIRWFDTYL
ncbi:S9 family peptidase [Virgibacillus pantothenticus]|uniref:Peptidase n=1 Tax=Virgibacillus pantothenticus TaxID=1473 RepID=A0A0L0QT73_VIRPA|nr:S9 family peptidase [Virgibacillus pantothenticus]KNE21900.1 peptidase [Virgibacillus pantothenticus]MED3735237.1 S9 family peptidase [Virgibacillus pantothenticus]QTY17143.1 S9 family peptidase [Virgibacillus pantothenticus]SIS90331.1 acylaminoacyl-peptidase [Virgibacillus pantothenticus]